MKITFDSGPIFTLTLTRMNNPNSELDPQDGISMMAHIEPRELMDEEPLVRDRETRLAYPEGIVQGPSVQTRNGPFFFKEGAD